MAERHQAFAWLYLPPCPTIRPRSARMRRLPESRMERTGSRVRLEP